MDGARRAHGRVAAAARYRPRATHGHRSVSTAHAGSNRTPRRALGLGLLAVATYAVLAAWSSSITPLARGPMLDGLGPVNYRWVTPPPELETTNQAPSAGRFELPLTAQGVGTQVAFTSDSQVTVVIDEGSI